jgi:hypothetical protein
LSCACNMASVHGCTKDDCPTSPHTIPSGSHWLHGQAFSVYSVLSAKAQSRVIQAESHKPGVAPILAEKPETHRKSPRKYQKNPINQTVQEIILGKSPYPNRNSPKKTSKSDKTLQQGLLLAQL